VLSGDHRDVADAAVRILAGSSTWRQHHELTGPRQVSWPEAMQALSAELSQTVTFSTTGAFDLVQRLVRSGAAPGEAQLLVAREWAIMAGENERVTQTVRDLTRHEPRTIEDFLHDNRALFR
jgi:NAD(P)H dehydrogenase (quinone)